MSNIDEKCVVFLLVSATFDQFNEFHPFVLRFVAHFLDRKNHFRRQFLAR